LDRRGALFLFQGIIVFATQLQIEGYMMKRILDWAKRAIAKLDTRDAFFFSGLILMGCGLWIVRPWISLTCIGTILTFSSMRR
jgi:hypothetical protein